MYTLYSIIQVQYVEQETLVQSKLVRKRRNHSLVRMETWRTLTGGVAAAAAASHPRCAEASRISTAAASLRCVWDLRRVDAYMQSTTAVS
jgi:hypothetical protein